MDDDSLATVIAFPLHRRHEGAPLPGTEPGSGSRAQTRPEGAEQYWALVQSLAAERRALGGGAG